jgi:hypothetical protein
MHRVATVAVLLVLVLWSATPGSAAVVRKDADFDLAGYDILEVETGDVTPIPQPDGIGRIEVTRSTPGSSGQAGDGFVRILIQGYDTSGSTGYGQIAAIALQKPLIDPAAAGGFASISYAETSKLIQGSGQGQATGVAIRQGPNIYIKTVGYTPSSDWVATQSAENPVTPDEFSLLQGPGPGSTPDLSVTGVPFQIGFFRATSGPAPSAGGTRTAALDDLVITLFRPCSTPADCGDDGNACTTETCTNGVCATPLVHCGDDGNPCTSDACDPATGACPFAPEPDGTSCADIDLCNGGETCQAGTCVPGSPPSCDDGNACTRDSCLGECKNFADASYEVVEAEVDAFLALISGPACGGEPLVKKLRKKVRKKVVQVRASLRKADAKTKTAAILALHAKATSLLETARQLLANAVSAELLSDACATELGGFLDHLGLCIVGLRETL